MTTFSQATAEAQTATNNRILIAAAARLESAGVHGDPFEVAKQLIDGAIRDGYAIPPKPVPLRGPGGSERARREALKAAAEAVRNAKVEGGRL